MDTRVCTADTGGGVCHFVAVRMVQGTVPPSGFTAGHPLGEMAPEEEVSTYTCVVHIDSVVEAMRSLGLDEVHTAPPPDRDWVTDGGR